MSNSLIFVNEFISILPVLSRQQDDVKKSLGYNFRFTSPTFTSSLGRETVFATIRN